MATCNEVLNEVRQPTEQQQQPPNNQTTEQPKESHTRHAETTTAARHFVAITLMMVPPKTDGRRWQRGRGPAKHTHGATWQPATDYCNNLAASVAPQNE